MPPMPPLPDGAIVVGQGLMGPRYIAIDTDGSLLVTGGRRRWRRKPLHAGGSDRTPTSDAIARAAVPVVTRGMTGQVTRIAADGAQSVVASGITSYNAEGPSARPGSP